MRAMLPTALIALSGCAGDGGSDVEVVGGSNGLDLVTGDPDLVCAIAATCEERPIDEPKTPCGIEVRDGHGDLVYVGPAGMELRGRSSLEFPKHQYGMELRVPYEEFVGPSSAGWRYLDTGQEPSETWTEADFDDSRWVAAPAPFGFGVDVATPIRPAGVTVWFRHRFTASASAPVEELQVQVRRDDGVIVYVNGAEVVRENLPDDVTPSTPGADVAPDQHWEWRVFDLPAGLVHAGADNVVAVEIHQSEAGTDDLYFDLKLRTVGRDDDHDLFGMGSDADWIVNGIWIDRSLFRNRLAFDTFAAFGPDRYAPELIWCELELDGEYLGVYTLGERIEQGPDRVDLPDDDSGEAFIVELVESGGILDSAIAAGSWELVYPEPTNLPAAIAVADHLARFEAAVMGPHPEDPETGIFAFVDLDSAVDYVLLEEFTRNADAYQLSVYLARGDDGKMRFVPWDFDLTFGYPFYDCGAEGWIDVSPGRWHQAFIAVPAFRERAVERWAELRAGALDADAIHARIATYDATLADVIEPNFDRWPIDEVQFTFAGTDWLCPVESYEEEHARVLAFIDARLAWMDAHVAEIGATP